MASRQLAQALRHLHQLMGARGLVELTDGQLLELFVSGQREEASFAALVQRHGPMVLGVCARVLHNVHDAEDAFQATFLMLFRRSRFLNREGSLANWLYTEEAGKTVVLKLTMTLGTLASGTLLTLAIGRIGGLMPALSAMRLKPLDSFR